MAVSELIEQLQKLPPDLKVGAEGSDCVNDVRAAGVYEVRGRRVWNAVVFWSVSPTSTEYWGRACGKGRGAGSMKTWSGGADAWRRGKNGDNPAGCVGWPYQRQERPGSETSPGELPCLAPARHRPSKLTGPLERLDRWMKLGCGSMRRRLARGVNEQDRWTGCS